MSGKRRAVLAALGITVALVGVAAPPVQAARPGRPAAFPACGAARDSLAAYGWPIRPFFRQHALRGTFGDPRTVERSDQTVDGPASVGSFSFHNGIDVVARDGTKVFAVVGGVAVVRHRYEVSVHASGDRVFQYWHIDPSVHSGEIVVAHQTVLGTVKRGAHHVHFGEIDGTRVVNPLAPQHIGPYRDVQAPAVKELIARTRSGAALPLDQLRGKVALIADTVDEQPRRFWGPWFGMPVMPAVVRWQVLGAHGAVVEPWRTAIDLRLHEPAPARFWRTYAPGTFQNFPVLDDRFHFGQPGRYLVRLTHFLIDTRTLADGNYIVHVVAADECGNRGNLRQRVTVANGRSI